MNRRGITLVEMMIVVAVMGIIAAIAIPSYIGIQKKGQRTEARTQLAALVLNLEKDWYDRSFEDGRYYEGTNTLDLMGEYRGFVPAKGASLDVLKYEYSVSLYDDENGKEIAVVVASPKEGAPEGFLCHSTINERGVCATLSDAQVCDCD